jgi:hypothetical protein
MFQGFLLPRGPRTLPEARVTRSARPVARPADGARRFTVRLAEPDDQRALERLAGLDSGHVPAGRLLVAEMGGGIQAAVPLNGGRAIANPFVRTAELVTLLELRAAQLRELGLDKDDTAPALTLLGRRAALVDRSA